MKVYNPATGELIQELAHDTSATLAEKLKMLQQGQISWVEKSLNARIQCIQKFVAALAANKDTLARTLSLEMGKPITESNNEIQGAIARCQYFIAHSEKWLTPEMVNQSQQVQEWLFYEPHGIIGNISAWNYPFLVGVNVFIPALIGGNAVFYKPSEYAALTGLQIQNILYKAGVPETVFQVAIGAAEIGEQLLSMPLDAYYFTGSYATGKKISQAVSSKLVPLGLEMGGKDPAYVMDDVRDIDAVAASLAEGSFYNNGQSCCAVERIYLQKSIYDIFLAAFIKHVKILKIGDPMSPDTQLGPLARPQHKAYLAQQIEEAVSQGAKCSLGGKAIARQGAYFEPTILTNVNHHMAVMTDETFGPVIGLQKVTDDDEALTLMQDTQFGLTAAVYSSDEKRAKCLLEKINTGSVYWNCCDRVSPYLPWSGRKQSGLGSTLSYLGILAFVKPKAYHLRQSL